MQLHTVAFPKVHAYSGFLRPSLMGQSKHDIDLILTAAMELCSY